PSCTLDDNDGSRALDQWLQGDTYLSVIANQGHNGNRWAEYAINNCQALDVQWVDGRVVFSGCNVLDVDHGIDPLIATSKTARQTPAWTTSGTCSAKSWQTFCRQSRILKLAELIGTASKALDGAVAYACEREQFGKTIGVNQAIKHR